MEVDVLKITNGFTVGHWTEGENVERIITFCHTLDDVHHLLVVLFKNKP